MSVVVATAKEMHWPQTFTGVVETVGAMAQVTLDSPATGTSMFNVEQPVELKISIGDTSTAEESTPVFTLLVTTV
jgi:hypothetical protein